MECPYCKQEMQQGVGQTGNQARWYQNEEFGKVSLKSITGQAGKRLGRPNPLQGGVLTKDAWFCEGCQKAVLVFDVT